MTSGPTILFWKRIDVTGLEQLVLTETATAIDACSSLICLGEGGFRVDHRWTLTHDWRVSRVELDRWGGDGHARVTLERADGYWLVDGKRRTDLDGAEESDLSATPFCNSFPIRSMSWEIGASRTLDTCFIDAAKMTVARSRQRYKRLGPTRFRYYDLGLFAGFEADLEVDARGLVLSYQHLFERVIPE